MKPLLPILFWLWSYVAIAQAKEVSSLQKNDTVKITLPFVSSQGKLAQGIKPEILTSGFMDIISNGQVNASARFIRLFIEAMYKFAILLTTNNITLFHFTSSPEKNV
jgi:hypothetical protein